MSYIKVTQKGSLIGQTKTFRKTINALGLGRISRSNVLPDNNCTRGMINQVKHLVSYELDAKPEAKSGANAKKKVASNKKVAAKKSAAPKKETNA